MWDVPAANKHRGKLGIEHTLFSSVARISYYFLAQCDKNQLGGRGRYLGSFFERSQLFGFVTFRLDTRQIDIAEASFSHHGNQKEGNGRERQEPFIHKIGYERYTPNHLLPVVCSHLLSSTTFQKCLQSYRFIRLKHCFSTCGLWPL